jgi:hypothetical protein
LKFGIVYGVLADTKWWRKYYDICDEMKDWLYEGIELGRNMKEFEKVAKLIQN